MSEKENIDEDKRTDVLANKEHQKSDDNSSNVDLTSRPRFRPFSTEPPKVENDPQTMETDKEDDDKSSITCLSPSRSECLTPPPTKISSTKMVERENERSTSRNESPLGVVSPPPPPESSLTSFSSPQSSSSGQFHHKLIFAFKKLVFYLLNHLCIASKNALAYQL